VVEIQLVFSVAEALIHEEDYLTRQKLVVPGLLVWVGVHGLGWGNAMLECGLLMSVASAA
jgi:hypothetical protein